MRACVRAWVSFSGRACVCAHVSASICECVRACVASVRACVACVACAVQLTPLAAAHWCCRDTILARIEPDHGGSAAPRHPPAQGAAAEAGEYHTTYTIEKIEGVRDWLSSEGGMEITRPDRADFIDFADRADFEEAVLF